MVDIVRTKLLPIEMLGCLGICVADLCVFMGEMPCRLPFYNAFEICKSGSKRFVRETKKTTLLRF